MGDLKLKGLSVRSSSQLLSYLSTASETELRLWSAQKDQLASGSSRRKKSGLYTKITDQIIKQLRKKAVPDTLNVLKAFQGVDVNTLKEFLTLYSEPGTLNNKCIKLATHGTDGSDGIQAGIHLRIGFDSNLGFPPQGFILYRKESDKKSRKCIKFDKQLKLPFTRGQLVISSPYTSKLNVKQAAINGQARSLLHINKITVFSFKHLVSNVSITLKIPRDVSVEVIAQNNNQTVWRKSTKGRTGKKPYNFKIPTTAISRLLINSKDVAIVEICYSDCSDVGPWEIINDDCGFGLPYLHAKPGKQYQKQYPCDPASAVIDCRLGDRCELSDDAQHEFRGVVSKLENEGVTLPVGWETIGGVGENNCSDENVQASSFEVSAYDLLMIQSSNPDMAKLLGLYWIDDQAEPGKYYDYKVVGAWPENHLFRLKNLVNFQKYRTGTRPFLFFRHQGLHFAGLNAEIVTENSIFGTQGLSFSYPSRSVWRIYFPSPVKEIQLFISQQGSLASCRTFGLQGNNVVHQASLTSREGVLVSYNKDGIRMIEVTGGGVILRRVYYDFEQRHRGLCTALACGVQTETPAPLKAPKGLKATCIRLERTRQNENCTEDYLRFTAGLHWQLPGNLNGTLYADAGIAYHVEQTNTRGEVTLVTKDQPVAILPEDYGDTEESFIPLPTCEGETRQRQYYLDSVDEKGEYCYRVQAIDTWGRTSKFSNRICVMLTPPLPPPPVDVVAKFIDVNTINPDTGEVEDLLLTGHEKNWLKEEKTSAIVVRWRWTPELQINAPDVKGFYIYLKNDWFNLIKGLTTAVSEDANHYVITTDQNLEANKLTGERLRQGDFVYKVAGNGTGPNSTIKLEKLPSEMLLIDEDPKPDKDVSFSVTLTKPANLGGMAIDVSDDGSWDSRLHGELKLSPSQVEYEVYLPIDAAVFPNYREVMGQIVQKTKYGQIGVNSYIEEGKGAVSAPASIYAVHRVPPPSAETVEPPNFDPSDGYRYTATPVDFFGKSTFYFRWKKLDYPGVRYNVYRAMDQSLFRIDRQNRESGHRTQADYGAVIQDLENKGLVISRSQKKSFKENEADYDSFNDVLLRALANMPDNISAFSKLNEKPLRPDDESIQDRDTDIPDPREVQGVGDNNHLMYTDDTLDGKGSNVYFYCTRTIDDIGNQGQYSKVGWPVQAKKYRVLTSPTIEIENGDGQIKLSWQYNEFSGERLTFNIYRSESREDLNDSRKRLHVVSSIPEGQVLTGQTFEFIDSDIITQTTYFYAVAAIDTNNKYSPLSEIISGQAFNTQPPQPVAINQILWIETEEDETEYAFGSANAGNEIRRPGIKVELGGFEDHKIFLKPVQIYANGYEAPKQWVTMTQPEIILRGLNPLFSYRFEIKTKNTMGLFTISTVLVASPL